MEFWNGSCTRTGGRPPPSRRLVAGRATARTGHPATEVARRLGCARTTIVKRLRKDTSFRQQIDAHAGQRAPGHDRLRALRLKVHAAIESEVQGGNVRVILWLADRMKLIEPPGAPTPQDELNQLIDGMSPEELVQFDQLRDTD